MRNSAMMFGTLSIVTALVALYSAFIQNISYENPLSLVGVVAIFLGIVAFRKGSKSMGIIGIIGGIPPTALFLFLFLFFALGGSR